MSTPVPPLHLPARSAQRGEVQVATIAGLLLAIFALYWPTLHSMAAIWWRSETFAHGFLVVPIFLFLVWRRRSELATLATAPAWPALLGVGLAGAVWLAGRMVNADVVSQLAMIAMVPFAVWCVLGTPTARVLAIPLAFLFFAVPFGEFLIPSMINATADFTVAALRASGVPVYREGNYFSIPSGNWSVVEACSGLRYLIASLMIGSLFAYLSYRSPWRRVAFIIASLLVPIIANWLRAYMIVMIAYLSSNTLAVGVDHVLYGWVFFGVVITLLLWVGSRWREDDRPSAESPGAAMVVARLDRRNGLAVLGTLAVAAVWPLLAPSVAQVDAPTPVAMAPLAGAADWTPVPGALPAWQPELTGARGRIVQTFAGDGAQVGLYLAFYQDQTAATKAITTTNLLVTPANLTWREVDVNTRSTDVGGTELGVRTSLVLGTRQRLVVWRWFWVDGRFTGSEYTAKLLQMWSQLRGHGDAVGWVVVHTAEGGDAEQATATLRRFSAAMGESIGAAFAKVNAQ